MEIRRVRTTTSFQKSFQRLNQDQAFHFLKNVEANLKIAEALWEAVQA